MKMGVGGLFYECVFFFIVICPFILLNILTYVTVSIQYWFLLLCLLNSIVLGIYYHSIWPIKEDSM